MQTPPPIRTPRPAQLFHQHWREKQGRTKGFRIPASQTSLEMLCVSSQSPLTLCDPMAVAHQAPPLMEFSRQEDWSGLPFPSQGIFLTQGLNPGLLRGCRQILYHLSCPVTHPSLR